MILVSLSSRGCLSFYNSESDIEVNARVVHLQLTFRYPLSETGIVQLTKMVQWQICVDIRESDGNRLASYVWPRPAVGQWRWWSSPPRRRAASLRQSPDPFLTHRLSWINFGKSTSMQRLPNPFWHASQCLPPHRTPTLGVLDYCCDNNWTLPLAHILGVATGHCSPAARWITSVVTGAPLLPSTVEGISKDWVEGLLRDSGAIPTAVTLSSIEVHFFPTQLYCLQPSLQSQHTWGGFSHGTSSDIFCAGCTV